MKPINIPVLLLGVLIAGCNAPTPKSDPVTDMFSEEQEQIKSLIYDIFEVAKSKDMDSLDSYHLSGPKFSKFDDGDIPQRQDYEMAKKTEEDLFTNVDEFNYEPPDVKVDIFDDVAIATFILDYSATMGEAAFTGKSRSTLVFVKDNGK